MRIQGRWRQTRAARTERCYSLRMLGASGVRWRLLRIDRAILGWLLFTLCSTFAVRAQQHTAAAFDAAGLGTGTRAMTGLWQFHLGDDPAWAQPGIDDSGWERLPADKPWGDAGHPGYTGFAWYRRALTLDPAQQEPLALLLPPLDSAVEVYWNGAKVGSVGTLPPHARWYSLPQPVAIPLPVAPGARSGQLAIRVWMRRLASIDTPDQGGLFAAPQIGYRPLIQNVAQQWVEHRLRTRAVAYSSYLLFLFAAAATLVLWLRSRSERVLLAVATYLGFTALNVAIMSWPSVTFKVALSANSVMEGAVQIAALFVVLLLAGLPRRPGLRGFRFWKRACTVFSCFIVFSAAASVWETLIIDSPHAALFRFLDVSSELSGYVFILFPPVLLLACFLFSRLTLPRLFLLAAFALDFTLLLYNNVLGQSLTRVGWVTQLLQQPLLRLGCSDLTVFTLDRMLLLFAILYAVWDRINQQIERQRFLDAELRAAHELQQLLLTTTTELGAPGYAVTSVYRPASEVGGDFFQVIPMDSKGCLIVAGDVSGKGLRAAMTVSLVVGALRTLAEQDATPVTVLDGLNRRLLGRTQGGFVTCCAVLIDSYGHALIANAGHCAPYLDGRELELPHGLPLGLVADVEYEQVTLDVSNGQQLALLSDGVVEARNGHGELYGFERLSRLMRDRPTAEQVAETAAGFGQEDDITVLTVTRLAGGE